MKFDFEVQKARFLERPNRFLVLAQLEPTGELIRAHCPDPGRLRELLIPGAIIYVSPAAMGNTKRKTSHVLRFVEHPDPEANGQLVSLDSRLPNQVFAEGLTNQFFAPFRDYTRVEREVPFPLHVGSGVRSRIDYRLAGDAVDRSACWVEVKSATLVENRCALFPDAVTARGRRHVLELAQLHEASGDRSAVVFIVQRPDVDAFAPQADRDPQFAAALREAAARGVEVYAYRCRLSLCEICLDAALEVRL